MYAREIGGKEHTFGVSGLLWNDNVLMYDHETESLWSQVKRESVTGPMTGTRLKVLPSTVTTWSKWSQRHPNTTVLTNETGHRRDYSEDPYESYYRSRRGLFSVFRGGPGEEAKEIVAGVEVGGSFKAYPLEFLRERRTVSDTVGGKALTLTFDPSADLLTVRAGDGTKIVSIVTYWMVWKGIHPQTDRLRP